jgi:hypothetical protein
MASRPNLFAYVGDVMGVMGRGRRDKRNGLTGMRDHLHMSTSAIALEPRFMFDAAGVATAVDAVTHGPNADALFDTADNSVDQALLDAAAQATVSDTIPTSAAQPAQVIVEREPQAEAPLTILADAPRPATELPPTPQILREADPSATGGRIEVAFIDSNVADWQTLADGVKPGVEVVVLDGAADGLAQMAAWAEGKTGYDAIHVLSHGAEGQVRLGTLRLDSVAVAERAADLQTLGAALNADGDLLLYGCDVAGGDGETFLEAVRSATGADVAASDDNTGSDVFGGDWTLEAETGYV